MATATNFFSYIFETSKKLDKVAFIEGKQETSYIDFYNKIVKLTSFIKENYPNEDNYFLLCSDNSIYFAVCYFAIIASGNTVIPIHPQTSMSLIDYILTSFKMETIFVQGKYSKKFESFKFIKQLVSDSNLIQIIENFSVVNTPDLNPIQYNLNSELYNKVAVIIFTSGSTGTPKGVMLSHKNLISNTSSIIEYLKITQSDIMMEVLPYSYCYGASWLHTVSKMGGTHIINNKFMLINRVLKEINDYTCTGFAGVPSHFQMLLRNSKIKEFNFPSLRFVAQAGGKLANVFIEELIETLPNSEIFIMYGQTEATARLSYLPPKFLSSKLGSIGKGIPNVTLEVLTKEGKKVKEGEIGSVVATGDNVMVGYWNDPEETSKTIRNNKLWTGDLAKVDKDGFIYIVDREKHFIKSGGHRISPKEIEDHIVKLQYVIECAVIGVTDDFLGEAPKAYVVLKQYNPEEFERYKEEIIEHCKKSLATFKIPKFIEFIKNLPKNTSNKVLVNELKKLNG